MAIQGQLMSFETGWWRMSLLFALVSTVLCQLSTEHNDEQQLATLAQTCIKEAGVTSSFPKWSENAKNYLGRKSKEPFVQLVNRIRNCVYTDLFKDLPKTEDCIPAKIDENRQKNIVNKCKEEDKSVPDCVFREIAVMIDKEISEFKELTSRVEVKQDVNDLITKKILLDQQSGKNKEFKFNLTKQVSLNDSEHLDRMKDQLFSEFLKCKIKIERKSVEEMKTLNITISVRIPARVFQSNLSSNSTSVPKRVYKSVEDTIQQNRIISSIKSFSDWLNRKTGGMVNKIGTIGKNLSSDIYTKLASHETIRQQLENIQSFGKEVKYAFEPMVNDAFDKIINPLTNVSFTVFIDPSLELGSFLVNSARAIPNLLVLIPKILMH